MADTVTRTQVLGFRVRAQQLDRDPGPDGDRLAGTALLDIGAQDTGPDGGRWALAIRGLDVPAPPDDTLVLLWTIRGAPHLYRRADLQWIAAAVQPFSDADAGKRIFDASKPLRQAGIGNLAALDTVATAMRSVVTRPLGKGEVSTRLAGLMDPPYLRFCRSCDATHLYEMPFRLAALRAGLELAPDTSPPVLRRIPGFRQAATSTGGASTSGASTSGKVPPRYDVVRAYLHLLGPATPGHVAGYLDAPVREVRARWPDDAVEVTVGGERRWVLAGDRDALAAAAPKTTRLLGPYDLFLQARDRQLLVDDPARAKALWPVLGRPGAVLVDGEIAGTWRPRTAARKLTVQVEWWARASPATRTAVAEQGGLLAAHRGVPLAGVDHTG